jgi:hypothetical protein
MRRYMLPGKDTIAVPLPPSPLRTPTETRQAVEIGRASGDWEHAQAPQPPALVAHSPPSRYKSCRSDTRKPGLNWWAVLGLNQ